MDRDDAAAGRARRFRAVVSIGTVGDWLGSELAEGYWRLAINLRDRLPEDELGLMRALVEGKGLSDTQRALLNFGLAAVLDAQGHYSQAAVHLESANALQATAKAAHGLKYDPEQHHQFIDRMIASFSSDFLARRRGWGDGDPRPVFVVGLPRSGTTLTEQILASHRQVHGEGELNEVHRVFRTLSEFVGRPDRDPFDALDYLTPESTKAAARSYLEKLGSLAPGTARRVVDKMPDNFRLIGLITLLWPSARVIVCGATCAISPSRAGKPGLNEPPGPTTGRISRGVLPIISG